MKQATHALALFLLAMLCSTVPAKAQSGSVNFGAAYYTTSANMCVNNSGPQKYPKTGSATISTPSGTINFSLPVLNPGSSCFPVTFNQTLAGSISGSTIAAYRDTNNVNYNVTFSSSGTSYVALAKGAPKYKVVSILYTPPGDASSSGFTNAVTSGDTTSIASNFSSSDQITFNVGVLGLTGGVTFTSGAQSGDTKSFQETTQASSGSQLNAVVQNIDHTQDQIFIWIAPTITVRQTGQTSGYYSLGNLDSSGNYNANANMDVVNVNIAGLKTPSLIPLSKLLPQVPGGTKPNLPGLASICAHPLPAAQCTQANACGCVASDFAGIVAQDILANDTNQVTPPSNFDSKRFVYIDYIQLQGPDQQGAGPVRMTFSISDASMSSETLSSGKSYSVAYSSGFSLSGGFTLGYTSGSTFMWTNTETAGTLNGKSHTGTAVMGTDKASCFEYVDVYEDTVFHTFAYSLPQAPPSDCQ